MPIKVNSCPIKFITAKALKPIDFLLFHYVCVKEKRFTGNMTMKFCIGIFWVPRIYYSRLMNRFINNDLPVCQSQGWHC